MRSFCALVLALFACVPVVAQAPFPARNVLAGQVVTVPKGDYLLTVQCTVQPGGKLVIDGGSNITVDGPGIVFYNRGTLEINGTAAEPVRVSSTPGKNCGSLFCPWVSGPRPQLTVSYLDWTSTLNANCFFLVATDFVISDSTITNRASTTATSRVCLAVNSGSVGVLQGCYLDGCNPEILKNAVGIAIGDYKSNGDTVNLIDTVIANANEPVKVRKQYTLVNGSIE